jgi:hypothetical protein
MARHAIRPTKITGNVFILSFSLSLVEVCVPFFPCLNRLLNALRAKPQLLFALHNLLSPERGRQSLHVYEVRPRKDHRGVNLIFDELPIGSSYGDEPE